MYGQLNRLGRFLLPYVHSLENAINILMLIAIALLPLVEIVGRKLTGEGIPGSIDYVRHLTLWIGFLGAALAARQNRHLALAFVSLLGGSLQRIAQGFASAVAAGASLSLAIASLQMVQADRASVSTVGVFPQWVAEIVMPLGFAVVGLCFLSQLATTAGRWALPILALGLLVIVGLPWIPPDFRSLLVAPGLALMLLAAAVGAPIFSVLGGAAVFMFFVDGVPIAAVPVEAYRIASSPILPTIPLFTLAGSILAEGQASARLVRVFRAFFGWLPGGTALATVGACAFFTTFTGGSGVTILALGGLMLPVLLRQGYGERFSLGAVTAAGSLGILFPPSLVIILYGVTSLTPINQLFVAGLAPGILLVSLVSFYAVQKGWAVVGARAEFSVREALSALWEAKWEVALPVVVLVSYFSGYATLVETAALAALYALIVECVIHRELKWGSDLPRILVECAVMVGGIMIILVSAMGLTNYLIDADIPTRGAEWVQSGIESRWAFLLALNAFLLLVGCLMDIFSAIVVVVPLIVPVAAAFNVDPVHLGIIFLANMQLGYLTPPVGMNLFLAAFRFNKPLLEVSRASLPFVVIMMIGVLVITYVPALTVGVVQWLGIP